jgi:hypothetical protein
MAPEMCAGGPALTTVERFAMSWKPGVPVGTAVLAPPLDASLVGRDDE